MLDADPVPFQRSDTPQARIGPLNEARREVRQNAHSQLSEKWRSDRILKNIKTNLSVEGLGLATCFFATDLHGQTPRYEKLLSKVLESRPSAVFLGGDLLPPMPTAPRNAEGDFVLSYLLPAFKKVRESLGEDYPSIYLIFGNDDPKCALEQFVAGQVLGLWHQIHGHKTLFEKNPVYGFAYVPPTPCLLKDWERYDVSRYVPPGCVSPEEGCRSVPEKNDEIKWGTIQHDLGLLVGEDHLSDAVFLFHTPPYDTPLDRAALDGKTYEHVALDLHVGSIAVRRFIEERQPLLTLHGHVHESTRLTGVWKIQIGRTTCINGAHDGPELALVRFDLESPGAATRTLL
jgi:Icc-related predicted phosphoesterase